MAITATHSEQDFEDLIRDFADEGLFDVSDAYFMALGAKKRGDEVLVSLHVERAQEQLVKADTEGGWDFEMCIQPEHTFVF